MKKELREKMDEIILKHQAKIAKEFDLDDAIIIQNGFNEVKNDFVKLFEENEKKANSKVITLPEKLRDRTKSVTINSNRISSAKSFTFKSLVSLLQMISKEDHNKAKEYCKKLVNELRNEKYTDDAEILTEFIDSW